MATDEMTPAKWGILGAAILAVVVAVGVVYKYTRNTAPKIESIGMSKDELMQQVAGPGSGNAPGGGAEVKSGKGRGATAPESNP